MAEYLIQSETLDDIADAINAQTGGSSAMTPAEMVTEIGSISGGGGISRKTYTGTLIYSDENVDNFVIPVDTRNAIHVDVNVRIVRTGTVVNGVVSYDDNIQPHSGFGVVLFSYSASTVQRPQVSYRYKEDVPNEIFHVPTSNASYHTASYANRVGVVTFFVSENSLKANGITLTTQNATRKICRVGLYHEFEYSVVVYE